MSLPVPTARLRERLEASIAGMQMAARTSAVERRPAIRRWFDSLSAIFVLKPQHAMGFASLVAIVALASVFVAVKLRSQRNNNEKKGGDQLAQATPSPVTPQLPVSVPSSSPSSSPIRSTPPVHVGPKRFNPPKTTPNLPEPRDQEEIFLPGEKSYLKAIARLTNTIDSAGPAGLRPGLRSEYERNVEVINQAIAATRMAAKRNPNDPDASEFLLSAYQSKVDLLNTVAEQAQLSPTDR
jgi:hypothetical protein